MGGLRWSTSVNATSMGVVNRSSQALVAMVSGVLLLCLATNANAHHLVPRHTLNCDSTFPCPPELQRRIDFWVMVFRKWRTDQAILHDTSHPERVYSVIRSTTCRTGARSIRREREKIQSELRKIATKLEQGTTSWSRKQQHLLKLFADGKPSTLRRAAKRIRCQQGNRDRFAHALKRFGTYREMISGVLARTGLPADIVYLPFVESAYNPNAYSRAGAAGLWQIMPRTARNLGLQVSATLDERMDPEQATLAAARYFENSIETLTAAAKKKREQVSGAIINPFVVTSYNYGVAGMTRAIRTMGPDYLRVLREYRSPRFRTAVRNFYASFLAARYVASDAEHYFGRIREHPPLKYHSVVLTRATSVQRISTVLGVDESELRPLNRALTKNVWRGWRLIPEGYPLKLPARDRAWDPLIARLEELPAEHKTLAGANYRVQRGDTACGIAQAFGVGCRDLIAANDLGRRALIRVGQKLTIPGAATRSVAAADAIPGQHRVRRGDTACGIATRYGVSCAQLIAHNGLGKSALIRVGQELTIPGAATRSVAAADAILGQHRVRRGDTACGIATRFGVSCAQLIAHNGLGKSALIRVGQQLAIPGGGAPTLATSTKTEPARAVPANYTVRRGDTACRIARRYTVDCQMLMRVNSLDKRGSIRVGQVLSIPGEAAPSVRVASAEPTRVAESRQPQRSSSPSLEALERPVNYDVVLAKTNGQLSYALEIEPNETLGHYADWLGLGSTRGLRALNRIKSGHTLHVGHRLLVPINDEAQRAEFRLRRTEYHRLLLQEFKDRYEIVDVREHRMRRGDSVWTLAQELELPLWIMDRFNPELRTQTLRVGDRLLIPVIQPRSTG